MAGLTSTSSSEKIVVLGACSIELITYVEQLPTQGQNIHGKYFLTTFGGKGANQAVAAGKLRGNVYLISRLGDDILANDYLNVLHEANVDTKFVKKTKGMSNGTTMILASENKTEMGCTIAGANGRIDFNDLNEAKTLLEKASVVLCQLEIDINVSIKALQMSTGITLLHATPVPEKHNDLIFTTPTVFIVHDSETLAFCGVRASNMHEAKEAVKDLLKKGCNSVILLMGAHGVIYASKREPVPIHVSNPKVTAVDSVSHSDCFVGSFAYLLAAKRHEMTMERILRAAVFCAAESTTKKGNQSSYPGHEVLDNYLAQRGKM